MTTTFGEVDQDADAIAWRLRVRAADVVAALDGASTTKIVAAAWQDRALAYLRAGVRVSTEDGGACAQTRAALARDPREPEATLELTAVFSCPARSRLHLHYELFFETDRFHQAFMRLGAGLASAGGEGSLVFRDGAREAVLVALSSANEHGSFARDVAAYLKLGGIHILTGYDHLCFLMALLLAAGLSRRSSRHAPSAIAQAASPREAIVRTIRLVSAFTIAHSLTLISQAFHPGLVSARWVEPAIAFSVAYVGVENLLPRLPRFRYGVVFGFGLVHGLGFASVLHEIGLPKRGFLLSLIAFNLGVELGQLAVLSLAFPIVLMAARRNPITYERWGLRLGSTVISVLGVVWLIARLSAI